MPPDSCGCPCHPILLPGLGCPSCDCTGRGRRAVMTRSEAITAINRVAWRLAQELKRQGDPAATYPAQIVDEAMQALGATAAEIDAADPA